MGITDEAGRVRSDQDAGERAVDAPFLRIEGGPDARKALASINALADFIEAERGKSA